MKMQIEKEKLDNVLKAIEVLLDEPTFNITSEGISVRGMDPSRVAMVDFVLKKEAFESFEVTDTDKATLNIGEIRKILKRVKKDVIVGLEFTKGQKTKIEIKGKYYRIFTVPVMEAFSEDVVPIPKVKYNAKAKLAVEGFAATIGDANMVSDHVYIKVVKDNVSLNATGDLLSAKIQLAPGDDVFLEAEVLEEAKSCYSLSYLTEIMKATKFADTVTVELSTDMPVKLSFDTGIPGKLEYYLAPRIEAE